MTPLRLDAIQLRVVGALIEKEITTPENYPLSLNALIAACNQRSSRDPVLNLTEDEVRQAVHSLEDMQIVAPVRDARVPKYEHRIRTVLNLRRDETAILCLLMLRGPQTPGELRGRADRMFSFDDIAAVQSTLERLVNRGSNQTINADSGPSESAKVQNLVLMLPRQPGSRESRFDHLLGEPVVAGDPARPFPLLSNLQTGPVSLMKSSELGPLEASVLARIDALEESIKALETRLEALETIK